MIIAIDHGNSRIKTVHTTFVSGFEKNPAMPEMADDWLKLKGSVYTLGGRRLPYRRDKTENEDFYILTLFAIAKEIEQLGQYKPQRANIHLAVGLPPAHLAKLKNEFSKYLCRNGETVSFVHNGKEFSIQIEKAYVFPQAYGAIVDRFAEIKALSRATVIDIGGYTSDTLVLNRGKLAMAFCNSFENGVIRLYNRVKSHVNAELGAEPNESDIDDVLCNRESLLPDNAKSLVLSEAQRHADMLLDALKERGFDLSFNPVYFVGGGAILLKPFILKSGKVKKQVFIENTNANAVGYLKMAKALDGNH